MIRDFQQTTVASIGLPAQAKTVLSRSSQLRRHASSAIAMFPGLRHSSLAYYGAKPLQRHRPPPLLLLLTDRRRNMPTRNPYCDMTSKPQDVCPLMHLPLPESSCHVRLRGGGNCLVPCTKTLCT